MTDIALFHSVLGVRPGVHDAADRLRAAGHQVRVVDQLEDPYREQAHIDAVADSVRAAGAAVEVFDYPGRGHLFTDPSLPAEYDPEAADLLWSRVLPFCA